MFLTVTIDTTQKNKIRFHQKKFDATSGWRKAINSKKRNWMQRFMAWRRSLKRKQYKLDGQIAMF